MTTIIAKNSNLIRLDSLISEVLGISRAKSTNFIHSSKVWVNGNLTLKPSMQVSQGDKIEIDSYLEQDCKPKKQNLKELLLAKPELSEIAILHQDSDILIINKPPNLVIHQAPNLKEPTLQDWLAFKAKDFGITLPNDMRYGIVHRLDRETSGALSIAKNANALISLSNQLKSRQMGRIYLAIVAPPLKSAQTLECYLGRNPKNRLKITQIGKAVRQEIAKENLHKFLQSVSKNDGHSHTQFDSLLQWQPNATNHLKDLHNLNARLDFTHLRYAKSAFLPLLTSHSSTMQLIAVKLFTGRTHQIRAQLESLGRHIIGDSLYGFKLHSQAGKECNAFLQRASLAHRIFLHAYLLYLRHPHNESDKMSLFRAQILADMVEFLQTFFDWDGVNEALDTRRILRYFRAF